MTAHPGARFGPADASPNVSTIDAARALGLSLTGVLHLITTGQLPCRRLPSGRRELPRVAVLALVDRRARAALTLELWPARLPAPRVDGVPHQLKLWQVRRPRPAKVRPAIPTAKERRSA